jgi:uncharacterized protein (DUF1330 family)
MNTYDIVDPDTFKNYAPIVRQLLGNYGAKVIASDTSAVVLEGKARTMNAIIQFPSMEAAMQCYNDPAYQEAKEIRHRSTANGTMVIVKEFVS